MGVYGIVRSADVSPEDVEIIYHYTPDRLASSETTLKKLDSTKILTPVFHNEDTTDDTFAQNVEVLGGLYNLTLQSSDFNKLGIYTLHLRPKQIRTKITDCGVLAALPSVRGIVIDLTNVPANDRNKFAPQNLTGYRIEYINTTDKKKITNFFRIVTSNFYCEPVINNQTNTNQKSIRYRYTDSTTNLVFLTLTPSAAPTTKPNTIPYIGEPDQSIILTNTYFNPTTLEIEMVEYDTTTLGYALYGNQSKAMSSGIYTIYDNNNNIYKQYNLYEVKDQYNETLYEIREKRTDIDQTLDFETITE
jgi:hypothetical protein